MADAFTEANRISTQVNAIDRKRAIITTREQARQDAIGRERSRKEPLDIVQQKFDVIAQELKATQGKLDKQESFAAFRSFITDGDPKHLNQLFKDNPRLRAVEAAGGSPIASFDKVDPNNDGSLIAQAKLDTSIFAQTDAVKNFIKVTHADGSKEILDMNKLFRGTGFSATLNDKELETLARRAKVAKLNRDIAGKSNLSQELNDKELATLARRARVAKLNRAIAGKSNLSQELNDLNAVARVMTGKKLGETLTTEDLKAAADFKNTILPTAVKEPRKTAAVKNLEASDAREQGLFDKFGGQDKFFSTDFSKAENRIKASSDIAAIEKLRGVKLSNQEKKKFREVNKLINLSSIATDDLSVKTTGIIDTAFAEAKKFVTNNVRGVKGRSAWAAYRNVIRHAMFGSVLTEAELLSFNQAFGSLKQQLGPVLEQLKVSISTLQSDIESIASTGDATVIHFRLGSTQDNLSKISSRLTSRINELNGIIADGKLTPIKPSSRLNLDKPKSSGKKLSDFKFNLGAN